MGAILLEGLEFFARHGYYEEEKKLGNRFIIDLKIETDFTEAAKLDDLTGTINYENLYNIVFEEMQQPSKLIENVAYRILQKIMQQFPEIFMAQIKVTKLNPPLGGICKSATVVLTEKRN